MALFTKNEIEKLTAELSRLEKKRTALSDRLIAAQAAEAAAQDARRKHLIESDDEDLSSGAKMAAAVETAQRERTAIEDAIATVDALIAEGRAAITTAKESAARQKRANEIAKRIEQLEPMIAEAESLFEKLAGVLEKIVEVADCPDLHLREYRVIQGPGSPLPAATLAGAALTEALFRSLPDGFSVSKMPTATYAAASLPLMVRRDGGLSPDLPLDDENGAGFRPLPLSGALTANLVDPLRTAAAEILNGSRPLASAKTMIEADDESEPVFDWRWIVFVKPARWQDWKGETVNQADSRALVPLPVFEAAVKAGVAFDDDAPEAVAQIERRYQAGAHHPSTKLSKSATVDLNVKWPATTRAAA